MTDGCEWVIDAHGCDPVRVADLAIIRALFASIVDELCLTLVADAVWHVFPHPAGITGLVPLAESHLTVHTFPEHGSLCINLFCCRPRPDWAWDPRLRAHVGATHVDVRRIQRSYALHSSPPLQSSSSPRSPRPVPSP
jgi:S-adenosylmethionine decarboxylase